MLAFIQAHSVVLAGLAVALLDMLVELSPLKSNSMVMAILAPVRALLKKDAGQV